MRKFGHRVLARADKRIDAQIERRPARQAFAFGRSFVAKNPRQIGIEPFRIIALNMRRRAGETAALECGPLCFAQRRRRIKRAAAQRIDRRNIQPALAMQHADQHSARGGVVHKRRGRGLSPQRVINETGDSSAVAGACKSVRQPPVFERVSRRTPLHFDVGKDLDGC